jgi:hypothetical protein
MSFKRTREAGTVTIAGCVGDFLDWHTAQCQHRSRYLQAAFHAVIFNIDADFIFEEMTEPRHAHLAITSKFGKRERGVFIQNLDHLLNSKIFLTRPRNHRLSSPPWLDQFVLWFFEDPLDQSRRPGSDFLVPTRSGEPRRPNGWIVRPPASTSNADIVIKIEPVIAKGKCRNPGDRI